MRKVNSAKMGWVGEEEGQVAHVPAGPGPGARAEAATARRARRSGDVYGSIGSAKCGIRGSFGRSQPPPSPQLLPLQADATVQTDKRDQVASLPRRPCTPQQVQVYEDRRARGLAYVRERALAGALSVQSLKKEVLVCW